MTYKKTDIISFWKRIAACMFSILILMMMVLQTSPSLSANAFYGNRSAFNSVTLTGNPADDIVNIAVAQKGKTTSQLSYTGYAWCVMFVCDCARIAGIGTDVIPNSRGTADIRDKLKNLGATQVSTAQKGDIIIYYQNGNTCHTALAINSTTAINGNFDGKVAEAKISSYSYGNDAKITWEFYRPKYTATPVPDPIQYANVAANTYYFKNASTGTYLSVDGAKAANGQNLSVASKSTTAAFQFKITGGTEHYFYSMLNNSFVVNPYSDNPTAGTNATLYQKDNSGTQIWKFQKVDGGYLIRLKCAESCALAVSGTNVQLATANTSSKAQIWTLEGIDPTLSSISISSNPTKTTYNVGDTLDTSGLTLKATYSDGNTETISSGFKTTADLSTAGTKTVTVSYTEGDITKTATFNVTVNAVLSNITVSNTPTKVNYYIGENLKTDGMKITATYTGGSTKDVTSAVKTSYDFSKTGTATVTVSYTENSVTKTATFTVSVEKTPVLFEGSGTEADPYLIQSKKDLETFRDAVNDTSLNPTYAHAYYLQTADIDLEEEEWIPIGVGYDGDDYLGAYNYQTRMFYGVYDGGNHYIYHLNIDKALNAAGFFGIIRGSSCNVSNLVIYGSVKTSKSQAGGITGAVHYGASIKNCAFIGDVQAMNRAGGIAGDLYGSGEISNCYHNGAVTSELEAGGITSVVSFSAYGSDGDTALIQNCYHANGTISSKEHTGAIVASCAYYDGIKTTVTIKNCYASTDSGANADAEGATVNTTQLLRASEMKLLAEDLGSSFANTPDKNLNDGYPVFTWQIRVAGDITQDGVISVEDVIVMQKYLHAKQKITKAQFEVADVNSDGKVNVYDLALLKRKLLQK